MAAKAASATAEAPPRNDAYTGILAISLLGMIASCVLLTLDFMDYGDTKPPALPQQGSRGPAAPAGAPVGAPVAAPVPGAGAPMPPAAGVPMPAPGGAPMPAPAKPDAAMPKDGAKDAPPKPVVPGKNEEMKKDGAK